MDHLKLTSDKLSVDEITELVVHNSCGAVSLFVGTTRDNFEGKKRRSDVRIGNKYCEGRSKVRYGVRGRSRANPREMVNCLIVIKLEYEAYEQMALKAMKNICNEIREKWPPVHGIVLHHRLGVVPVREASVVIAISSPHRTDSLEAVAFCIDRLKSTVPIWKKEIYESDPPAWKENPECFKKFLSERNIFSSGKTEPEYPELTLEKNLVQINVSREQLQQRINNFIERKREQVNVNNIHDFIPSKNMQQVDESETCARVRTSFVRRKDSKGHLKVRKVINEWGPQTSHPMVKSESRASTGLPLAIAERVMNIEKFLNIAPVEPDIYQRLKNMEDRIAYLQSISPEYSQFWNRHDLEDNIKRENDMDFLYTADDLSRKIEQLERNGDDL